jgi:lipopolysaccharide cholinephosphotransferase
MPIRELKGASREEHQAALLRLLTEFDRVCSLIGVKYQLFAGTLLGAVRHKGFIPWDDDLDVIMMREDYDRFLRETDKYLDTNVFFLQKEFSEHWPMFFSKLRLNGTACIEKYRPKDPMVHQGIYIDIFPCDDAKATAIGKRMQFLASKVVIAKSLSKRGYETKSAKKKLFMAFCKLLPMKPFLKIAKSGKKNGKELHSFFAAARNYSKNVYPRELLQKTINCDFEGGSYPIPEDYDTLLKTLYGEYMVLPSPDERKKKQHAIFVDTENSYEKYRDLVKELEFDVLTESIR